MLKYLETVTEDLLMISVLIALFWSMCRLAFGHKGDRFIAVGMIAGAVASALMAWAKNKRLDRGILPLYGDCVAVGICFTFCTVCMAEAGCGIV